MDANVPFELLKVLFSGGVASLLTAWFLRKKVAAEALKIDRESLADAYAKLGDQADRQFKLVETRAVNAERAHQEVVQRMHAQEREMISLEKKWKVAEWQLANAIEQSQTASTQLRHALALQTQYREDSKRYIRVLEMLEGQLVRTDDIAKRPGPEPPATPKIILPARLSSPPSDHEGQTTDPPPKASPKPPRRLS